MSHPPILTADTISADEWHVELRVPPELPELQGHFPGEPILPGVVQVDWAVQLAAEYFGFPEPVGRDFKVKFTRIIRPEMPLQLKLKRSAHLVSFTYLFGNETMSSGSIRFGENA